MSSFPKRCLDSLRAARAHAPRRRAIVGLDGFVDTIVKPVATRTGQGGAFTPIASIPQLAARIAGAAGKSTNLEIFPIMSKPGGNGPLMAAALSAGGAHVTCIGALGEAGIHPVFRDFTCKTRVVSLCDPAATTAIELSDGKIMLGQLKSLDGITLERIYKIMGNDRFHAELADSDLVALVNWTMIPNMTNIFRGLVVEVLPSLPPKPADAARRAFFFDLADPEKRTREDLLEALGWISRFGEFGNVTLGLNLKEAQQIATALNLACPDKDEASLRSACANIRERLGLATVVIHPRESAACATDAGTAWVPGPYCENPVITTGAGDHFNGGFSQGQLLGLDPESCLAMGVCTSGYYVRTAKSPDLDDIERFLVEWV